MKKIWQRPWGYSESFIILTGLFIVSLLLEFAGGGIILRMPSWPLNIVFCAGFFAAITIFYLITKKSAFSKWLTGLVWSSACVINFLIYTVIAGLLPQTKGHSDLSPSFLGLGHIVHSRMLAVLALVMMATLYMVFLKRLILFIGSRFKNPVRNIIFLLNHLGFLLVIVGFFFGSGDYKKARMTLTEGETQWVADIEGAPHSVPMPFALKLKDFRIEEEPVKIQIVTKKGKNRTIVESEYIVKRIMADSPYAKYSPIKAEKFYEHSYKVEEEYVPVMKMYDAPAAYLDIVLSSEIMCKGWVSCGSEYVPPSSIKMHDLEIIMPRPAVKSYISEIKSYFPDETVIDNIVVSVNHPYNLKGWYLYQADYDRTMGKWSETSIIEAIRDPWLPVIYSGIGMLLAGAAGLFLLVRKTEEMESDE